MDDRDLARYYASGRVGIGVLLFLFPRRLLKVLLGADPGRAVGLVGRMVGARDAILGAGTIAALQEDHPHSVRPWMVYGMAADGLDALGMLFAFPQLPKRRRVMTFLMALGGAAAGAYLMTRFEDESAESR